MAWFRANWFRSNSYKSDWFAGVGVTRLKIYGGKTLYTIVYPGLRRIYPRDFLIPDEEIEKDNEAFLLILSVFVSGEI